MGKLIKNHWARLVILTAAACKQPSIQSPRPCTNNPSRPNSSSPGILLLAENLLGLPHQESRLGRKTVSHPPNHQPPTRLPRPDMGMAPPAVRRHRPAPLHRGTPDHIPAERTERTVDIPGHELRPILHHRDGSVFLGLQRRRGTLSACLTSKANSRLTLIDRLCALNRGHYRSAGRRYGSWQHRPLPQKSYSPLFLALFQVRHVHADNVSHHEAHIASALPS